MTMPDYQNRVLLFGSNSAAKKQQRATKAEGMRLEGAHNSQEQEPQH